MLLVLPVLLLLLLLIAAANAGGADSLATNAASATAATAATTTAPGDRVSTCRSAALRNVHHAPEPAGAVRVRAAVQAP